MIRARPSAPYHQDDGISTCCVCCEQKRSLKVLPCCHLFCEFCLQNIIINANYAPFPCPLCRAKTEVPEFEASGFPVHGGPKEVETRLVVVDTAEVEEVTLETLTSPGTPVSTCNTCDLNLNQTLYLCTQCRAVVCEWCQNDHLQVNHSLVLVRSRDEESDASQNKFTAATQCERHGGHPVSHWCLKCRMPLCEHCLLLDPHRKHKTEELSVSGARAREKIQKMDSCIQPLLSRLEWVHTDLKHSVEATERSQQDIEREIHQRAEEVRQRVDLFEKAAIASLRAACSKATRKYAEDLEHVESKLSGLKVKQRHIRSALENGSDVTLAHLEVSAWEHVRRKSHLTKFTSHLPRDVLTVMDSSAGSVSGLEPALEKFVGSHRVVRTRRRFPDFN